MYVFLERGEGKETVSEGEKHHCVREKQLPPPCPNPGRGPQPRHVP